LVEGEERRDLALASKLDKSRTPPLVEVAV
jgi:hypothetical protein